MKTILSVIVLSFCLLFVSPILSFGQENQKIDKNLEGIVNQYAECTAYFEWVFQGLEVSDKAETAEGYKKLRDNAMFYSLLLANQGRKKDMAIKVTNSRIEMYKKAMKEEIDNRYENLSILTDKYLPGCLKMLESPPAELTTVLVEKMIEAENQTKTTYDLTVSGKSCVEGQSQQLECTYQVGKDLNIAISGIGQPDTSITFMKSDLGGDFYASHGLLHGCIIVKRGDKGITSDQLTGAGSITDLAFISPQNGKVYTNWKDCQSAY